jgi:AcrR family transcriptional regulator
MTAQRSPRAEEVLEHAMRLFAERGYSATSVADIQEAAGMRPGSGALYKHFPSKEALLQAGIDRFVESAAGASIEVADIDDSADLRSALRRVARIVLATLESDEATVRIAWRDLAAFPHIERQVVDDRIQPGFAGFAAWLQRAADRGHVDVADPRATAGVLLGSLVFFRIMDILLGARPADLDEDQFLDAWLDVAVAALTARA